MAYKLFNELEIGARFISGDEYLEKVAGEHVNAIPALDPTAKSGYIFEDDERVYVVDGEPW